jgi:hypothetical protein
LDKIMSQLLSVQDYLLSHTLDELAREHGVYARFSSKNSFKFSLNYDQLEARDADPISQDCRGLVLRVDNDDPMDMWDPTIKVTHLTVGPTTIIGWPMRRFFNYGQGAAALVNFDSADTRFFEKLDGTLCIVYWDRDLRQWSVATRSVPDADLPMDGFGIQTFTMLFWKAFALSGGNKEALFKGNTYCFELCTPDNQVVVRYTDYKVFLLAVRFNMDGQESLASSFEATINIPAAPSFRFGSVAEMVDFVSSRDPSSHEGIVVCDKDYNRVKVKNPGYLALNKIKDSVAKSPRAALEIVLLGKEDDVMPLVAPHIQEIILGLKDNVRDLIVVLDEAYLRLHDPDRKTFALAVQAEGIWLAPMMIRWSGKASSTRDWIQGQRTKSGSWSDGFLDALLGMCKEQAKK